MSEIGRGKPLSSQAKEIVYNVYTYMKKESERASQFAKLEYRDDFKKVMERVGDSTGVCMKTVRNIITEKKSHVDGTSFKFKAPKLKRNTHPKHLLDKDVILKCIHAFHTAHQQMPTVAEIRTIVEKDANFTGSASTLARILKYHGFKWKKTEDKKRMLIDTMDVAPPAK